MLGSLFFSPGDLVFVEDPTYFVALRILGEDRGLKCVPGKNYYNRCLHMHVFVFSAVPIDGNGIIIHDLEQSLEAHLSTRPRDVGGNKPFWSMLYLIPTFHNPTGACLSPGMYQVVMGR